MMKIIPGLIFTGELPQMASFPTTSTASVGTYQALYERILASGYDQVLSIHCSKELSGIFNAASTAANALQGKVVVVDSRQLSLGLGFQVLEAADAISKGTSLESILDHLATVRERIRVVAMLDTLEFIHRSGRVSSARARLGGMLQLKPFLDVVDGNVYSMGQVPHTPERHQPYNGADATHDSHEKVCSSAH